MEHNQLHAQACSNNRYIDEIFSSQVTQDVLFANADPYGLSSSQDLRMDIYEPIGDLAASRPLIVYAFGGAYLIGDKRQPDIPRYASHFAKQGFVVASIDYRIGFNTLSTGSAVRAVYRGIQDLRAAVRFLCENRSTYRIDTNYIFYSGSSAGCISGLHASFMTDVDRPSYTYGGVVLLEPDDMGCADCSGNTLYGQRVPKPAGIISRWGALLDTSYITAVPEDSIPTISFHGTADLAVPFGIGNPFSFPVFPVVMGSSIIHDRLSRLNIYNQLVPLVGAGHEPELLEPRWDDTIFAYCTPFLYQILKPNTSAIAGPSALCLGDTVSYSVTMHNGSSYCWNVDSSTTIVNVNNNQIRLLFSSAGTHTIWVRELNGIQCYGDSVGLVVNVLNRPIANFSFLSDELQVRFFNSSVDASSQRWFFGDGTSSSSISPVHTYTDTGWYRVILKVDNGYCSDSIIQDIYITKCPRADFSYSLDADGNLYLFNNSSYYQNLLWTFGDGDSSNAFNPAHQYTDTGSYLLSLIAFNDSNCRDSLSVQIRFLANTSIDAHSQQPIHLYPNPCDNFIGIEAASDITNIEIMNTFGQRFMSCSALEANEKISVEHLPIGIYYLQVQIKDSFYVFKLLKQ